MHATLTPRANFKLIALWSVMLIGCMLFASASAALPFVVYGFAGTVAGALQLRALREHRSSLLRAETALQVRRALVKSVPGKVAVGMVWISGAFLVVLVFARGEYANLPTVLGSYAAFALIRECVALPGVFDLARA